MAIKSSRSETIIVPFVRSPYNYDTNAASDESALQCLDPSLTKQEFAEDADINTIVRRFNITGQLPQNVQAPVYGDFEGVFDFQSAMNIVVQAEQSFMAMPAEVRARFLNNPQRFVEFCSDERNRDEAVRLGLVFKASVATSEPAPAKGAPDAPKGASDAAKAS